jgi:protein-tyrosine phosphatase
MPTERSVLFICTGNYYRSRHAELYFNARVPPGLGWRAVSRGLALSRLNPGPIARSVLARLSSLQPPVVPEVRPPLPLTQADLEAADRIVALDADEHPPYVMRDFPAWHAQIDYWRIPDADRMTVADALAAIERAVDALIRDLAEAPPAQP